eukprot:42382_1
MSVKTVKISGKKRSRDDLKDGPDENELNINHKKRKTESMLNEKINELEELEKQKQVQINILKEAYEKQIAELQEKIDALNTMHKQGRKQIVFPFNSQINIVTEEIELLMQQTGKNKPLFCRTCFAKSEQKKMEMCSRCKNGICESCCVNNRCSGISCEIVTCDNCRDREFAKKKCGVICCTKNECDYYHYKYCDCGRESYCRLDHIRLRP